MNLGKELLDVKTLDRVRNVSLFHFRLARTTLSIRRGHHACVFNCSHCHGTIEGSALLSRLSCALP